MSTTLTPYLTFDGNTREAFKFYESALGAKIKAMLSYADMPAMEASSEACGGATQPTAATELAARPTGDGIMHGCLVLPGGALLFAGDTPPGMPFDGVKGMMIALQYDTVDEAHSAFNALSQGGQVTMPMAGTFWAEIFGMLTDRFGISWAVNGVPIEIK